MVRALFGFAALLMAYTACAAPAPEPFVSGWSKPIDPDGDCKVRRDNRTVVIEMPGSYHDYDPIRGQFNSPRILRDIAGNFEIQVRVRVYSRPSPRSTVEGQPSFVSAGFLLIYPESDRYICDRMEYGVMQQDIGLESYAAAPLLPWPQRHRGPRKGIGEDGFAVMKHWFCKNQNVNMIWDRERLDQFHALWDRGWKDWPLPKTVECAYLRLEQRGGEGYSFFISPDGEKWTKMGAHLGPPTKVKLGLAAFSTSSEPSKVRFDQFKLTWGKKKSR